MELVSDVGRVESRFTPFEDSVSVSARLEHGLHRTDSYVMRLKWKLGSVSFRIVLLLMQDWCTVCTKCTISIQIILDALDGTPR
jgi:hypothetical protein